MAVVQVSLLAIAVIGVFVPRLPSWLVPVAAAVVLLLTGGISFSAGSEVLEPLVAPLAFLLLAVPLAVMLDRVGFFSAAAALIDRGRDPRLGLWALAASVTTFLNLDASVVLLTPLYIRFARRHGLDARLLAFQPVLLACLASSALPISNLTNLIAADALDIGFEDFLLRLGPASLAAVVVGWCFYRRLPGSTDRPVPVHEPVDRRALRLGLPIVVFVILGFTVGDALGIKAWMVALVADAVLLLMTRDLRWGDFPWGAAGLAVGLGLLAAAAAPHLGIDRAFDDGGWLAQLRTTLLAMAAADTINNLPALLISLPGLESGSDHVWPLLFGVNFGPIFVLHGALAGLLWRDTAARLGVQVSAWEYTRVGLRVGTPALLAGLAIVLATGALVD
ncbi:citrate transporter [Frankia sp. Cpl3]|uniref:SLC13 family permease n=1 Tax=Parafrankia colletiae TaxID=573497 RepID=UPI000B2C6819|nr:SLC13 family permease [Parafrankia colletiae]MCK9902781.1 citrate transporter [Frankia sp. Cpl3]